LKSRVAHGSVRFFHVSIVCLLTSIMSPQETLAIPAHSHDVPAHSSTSPNRSRKPWMSTLLMNRHHQRGDGLSRENTQRSRRSGGSEKMAWWQTRLFSGMINDIRRRAPFYWSDWKDAWDYRVVPATVYMYFAKYVVSRIMNSLDPASTTTCIIIAPTPWNREYINTDPCSAFYLL
jgi:hypothetical protein